MTSSDRGSAASDRGRSALDRGGGTFLRLDIVLILSVLGLIALGIAFIYSSGITSSGLQVSDEWSKQIIWSVSGLGLMVLFASVDYRRWRPLALPIYSVLLALLILVLILGDYVKGARAWLGFGPVGIQPSEFGKLALIIALAWWYDERGRGQDRLRIWIAAIGFAAVPVFLVLLQPDLGTAIVYIPILLAISLTSGVEWKFLFFPAAVGILLILGILGYARSEYIAPSPMGFYQLFTDSRLIRIALPSLVGIIAFVLVGWFVFRRPMYLPILYGTGIVAASYTGIVAGIKVLRGYQMMRLVVFLNPQIDPRGAGWHIIQSITAIGSGGILGKGFLRGTQSHYQYLPEQSTDFIFSILAEETGFLGSLLVFALFTIIILRALYIAYTAQDRFGTAIASGIAGMFGYHVIQNIGMAIGVMPITGIPLFFLSYGGSSLWTALISIGLLLSIHYRR